MSRILIVGGTRFVGRRVATLLAPTHDVLVLSRNSLMIPGAERLVADRLEGLGRLSGRQFDVVMDFLAYDEAGVADACALGRIYLVISSTWLFHLSGPAAGTPSADRAETSMPMLPVTMNYLRGKARVEAAIHQFRAAGRTAVSLRLPIIMGAGDHTRRLEFYRSRIADGGPLLLVNGGGNVAQVVWSEDVARVLVGVVDTELVAGRPIWEALPDAGTRVAEFVRLVAGSMGRTAETIEVPSAMLADELPAYLESEPLWRERPISRSDANLFAALGLAPTPAPEWLATLPPGSASIDPDRPAEIALARRLACSPH